MFVSFFLHKFRYAHLFVQLILFLRENIRCHRALSIQNVNSHENLNHNFIRESRVKVGLETIAQIRVCKASFLIFYKGKNRIVVNF